MSWLYAGRIFKNNGVQVLARRGDSIEIRLQLKVLVAGLLGALLALGLLVSSARGTVQEQVDESAGIAPHAAGELLVTYESGVGSATAEELPGETGGEIEEEIPEIETQVIEFPEVKAGPTESQREQLLRDKKQELKKDPGVESVSYNYIYEAAYTPNDVRFGEQYGLQKIRAPLAWGKVRGGGVDIAIVDSGISDDHPDLERKISAEADCINDSAEDLGCVEGRGEAGDESGHGTKVSGVAAAGTNNKEGIAGTCPNCKILAAKSLNADLLGTASDIAGGITWATNEGAEVINLSLAAEEADSPQIKRSINRARKAGAVVVAAAGNYGKNSKTVYPAAYRDVIAVAATDRNDRRAKNSSTGDWVDVTAPGVGILSTNGSSGYKKDGGTSYSSPFVAGVAGLLAAQGRSPNEIRRRINSTARDLGPRGKDEEYGRGLVDAAAAVGVRNKKPRVQRLNPGPGSSLRNRTPRIKALVRDEETDLKKSDLTFVLDGNRKTSFRYDPNSDRLSYSTRRKLAPGRHSVRVTARDARGAKTVRAWGFYVKAPPESRSSTNTRQKGSGQNDALSTIRKSGSIRISPR